jgi:rhamnosyltransferase
MGFSKKAWENIGRCNEDYIIDHVDTDFCMRALDKDYKIYVNYDICLKHAIGKRTTHNFLGVTIKPNHHNYIRKYYIVRNGTHLAFKYFLEYPSYFYLNILRVAHEFVCVLFYEKNKIKKTLSMLKGLCHSMYGKLGSYV